MYSLDKSEDGEGPNKSSRAYTHVLNCLIVYEQSVEGSMHEKGGGIERRVRS